MFEGAAVGAGTPAVLEGVCAIGAIRGEECGGEPSFRLVQVPEGHGIRESGGQAVEFGVPAHVVGIDQPGPTP